MPRFSIWEVEAKNESEAIEKARNWDCTGVKFNCRPIPPSAKNSIPIENILKETLGCLKSIQREHKNKSFYSTDTYLTRANALIELVEIYDCGHIGGFGDGQLITNEEGSVYMDVYQNIFARFLWLYEKYVSGKITDLLPSEVSGELSDFWRN